LLELHDNEENLGGVSFSLDASVLLAIAITTFCAALQRLISLSIEDDGPAWATSVMPATTHPSFQLQLTKSKSTGTKDPARKPKTQTNYIPASGKTSEKLDIQNLFSFQQFHITPLFNFITYFSVTKTLKKKKS
jgi:hypothetical protein